MFQTLTGSGDGPSLHLHVKDINGSESLCGSGLRYLASDFTEHDRFPPSGAEGGGRGGGSLSAWPSAEPWGEKSPSEEPVLSPNIQEQLFSCAREFGRAFRQREDDGGLYSERMGGRVGSWQEEIPEKKLGNNTDRRNAALCSAAGLGQSTSSTQRLAKAQRQRWEYGNRDRKGFLFP